ncbi:MAG: GLUG motif-containing protein, partial [Paracoccaceae bacterium]|nr:GLUG motif-containing protein [Paracoccaceae bacterium]
ETEESEAYHGSTGGLVGNLTSSTITNAYATGAVSGTNYIGGLMGFSTNSNIANVYATGAVSGTNYIGVVDG